MSVQNPPSPDFEFHGVYTAGNPVRRPKGSAEVCRDFRVMPGWWLRLRGGRKARNYSTGEVRRIFAFRDVNTVGASNHLAQVKNGVNANWSWFSLATYAVDPFNIESIATTYDSGFALTNPAAVCNLSDRPLFYNGLGVRDGVNSRPPFSTYGSAVRFYGLDAYCPSGNPSAAFTAGAGNNTVSEAVSIYVGLYHQPTAHFSNAVLAGTIATTGGSGTIAVSSLGNLAAVYHNGTEQAELFYVFYATVDGGKVPYLILNAALDGPHKVAIGTGSTSLSIAASTTNGWNLDLTKEAPVDNFPPRPMATICYVNGRLYGALMAGGSGSAIVQTQQDGIRRLDFSYIPEGRDRAAVVFSRAPGDFNGSDLVGDALQCWPLTNIAYTPDGLQPLVTWPALDDVRVLVITPSSTFLLEEVADGIHEYKTVSRNNGIKYPTTLQVTPYGIVWVDQHNQIVILAPGSVRLEVLSAPYQSLLSGLTPQCADYLLNPKGEIDRYEVFMSGGTSVIHDFRLGGEGYSCSGKDFTAASTCSDSSGIPHHIVAKNGLYTQEVQPDTGLIPTTDETYTAPTTVATTQVNGEWRGNWESYNDEDVRKEMYSLDIVGDGATSAALSASPLTVELYKDFEEVTSANKQTGEIRKGEQSTTDSTYQARFAEGHAFWWKWVFKIAGHSSDDASFASHVSPATQGNLVKNFYGSILSVLRHVSGYANRR